MDNPSVEPIGALDVGQAANLLAGIIEPKAENEEASEVNEPEGEQPKGEEAEPDAEASETETKTITVEVDGKLVELTPEQIADAYKNGLRQDDYTRKTQLVAEERKAAEAEIEKARQERNSYGEKLNTMGVQLQAALQEQSQINWTELLENDPVEYLKQQHLYQDRQAKLNQIVQELDGIKELNQKEQQEATQRYLSEQQALLIEKVPAWKDEAKAKEEKNKIRDFLLADGFTANDIAQIADHRHLLLIRDAMQFRQLLKSAPDATKRIEKAPTKAERSVSKEAVQIDKRTESYKRFAKSGSVNDAATVLAGLI